MGLEYVLQTARAFRGDAEVPVDPELMAWLEEPMGWDDLERLFEDVARDLGETTLAALFLGEEDDWALFVVRQDDADDPFFLEVVRRDGSAWPPTRAAAVTLNGAGGDVAAFERRFGANGAADLVGPCDDVAQLEAYLAELARLASNEEPAAAAGWVGGPVGVELARGRYRLQPLSLRDETGTHQALLDRVVDAGFEDTGWVTVTPSRPEKVRSSNPLRAGSLKKREQLANQADRRPSQANVAHLIEARFAPECRVARAAFLRATLDRALGRHDEDALDAAWRSLRDACEDPEVRAELERFEAQHPSPGAALRAMADGRLDGA